jgi:hypothetical protein
LLQLYRIGLVTNDSTRQDLLAELKMKHQMSAEKSFAEALECESLGRFAEAKEKAVNAWSHARKEPTSLSHLALEAMKFAYHTHFKSTHTPEENEAFSNAVATQLFKLDANDSMAWQIVCSTLLERGTPDATAWESIDKLLSVAKSPTGAYVAGTHAHKRNDIQRAWDYLSQVTGRSGQALRAKILSADLAHSEGDHEGATKLYRYVSTWAPHHPALPSFLIEGTPIRVVTPMVLAPQVLPVADWSPPTRLAISDAVLAVKSGQPPMQALSAISQYATLQDLLRYDSALFEKCHDAVRELGSHVEALSPFLNESNPSTWGLLPWSSSHLHWNDVVHIHEALNPEGHKYTFGQFANLLQNLERAAATLDPGMQHLAPLRLHERLHRAAERTRRAHGRCTELYNTSKGGDARLQSVKELVSEITQVRELLVHEITANLRRGKDTLGEWTGKLLSLPNGILLDMQEREEHRTFVDTRIRRKHLQ